MLKDYEELAREIDRGKEDGGPSGGNTSPPKESLQTDKIPDEQDEVVVVVTRPEGPSSSQHRSTKPRGPKNRV